MDDNDTKEVEKLTREAHYSLKTAQIKDSEAFHKEIASFVYKAYAIGKESGLQDRRLGMELRGRNEAKE